MQGRNWIVALIAIVVGLVAVVIANAYFSGVEDRRTQQIDPQQMAQIVVATQPLEFGTKLIPQNIKMQAWPASSIPQGAFMSIQDALRDNRVALRPIVPGEPVLASKVSGTDGRATLAALLPEGMRAVSVPVGNVEGVSGFVLPGTMVDVMLTRQIDGEGAKGNDLRADIILQNVQVLAVDQNNNDKDGAPKPARTATVAVTLYDAQRLSIAQKVGSLSLVLRKVEAADNPQGDSATPPPAFASTVTRRHLGGPRLYIPPKVQGAAVAYRPAAPAAPRGIARPAASITAPSGFGGGATMTIFRGSEPTTYPVGR